MAPLASRTEVTGCRGRPKWSNASEPSIWLTTISASTVAAPKRGSRHRTDLKARLAARIANGANGEMPVFGCLRPGSEPKDDPLDYAADQRVQRETIELAAGGQRDEALNGCEAGEAQLFGVAGNDSPCRLAVCED